MTRYPTASQDVKFIDIDYKDLMIKKQTVVRNTPELNSMLTNLNIIQDGDILLSSDQYLQLGCDLRDLKRLEDTISKVVDIEKCSFLFTAEVSITYMPTESADALIQWANKLPEGTVLSFLVLLYIKLMPCSSFLSSRATTSRGNQSSFCSNHDGTL